MGVVILILSVTCAVILYTTLREDRSSTLTVSFLDVGQGDSIYIESPTGTSVLIDGGPTASVLRQLGTEMPWYDRTIDLIIPTHPDADHIGGLIDVLGRYRTSIILESSVGGNTATWKMFRQIAQSVHQTGTRVIQAQRGQIIDLGGGAYIEVLFPDRTVPDLETNTGCIVSRLVYGKTAFLFDCDAPQAVERYLVSLDGIDLQANVLKAGHHGSKTSSARIFVGYVNPQYVVYSRACDNTYGFPHKETLETFKAFEIPTLDTCKRGTITFMSNGEAVHIK